MIYLDELERYLEKLIPEKNCPEHLLFQGARYALEGGGKRIRPLLLIASGVMCGSALEPLLAPASAVELIHTYSLIHDDLPAMDDDDFRRGKPSLHKAFGEGNAILVGDYLLTYAFEILSSAPHLAPEQKLKLITTLARASGAHGMIGGQIMDIGEHSDKELTNAKKTGALIQAAVVMGGIVAHAPKEIATILSLFGEKIGALFQLCDDLLDGDHQGPSGEQKAIALHEEALSLLSSLPGNSSLLQEISHRIIGQLIISK